jgi:two-component system, NtrC family, sensor kinase
MTLRHRLLLVYGIVVLLSIATVAMALFELDQARRVYGALQNWSEIVLAAQKLHDVFHASEPPSRAQLNTLFEEVPSQYRKLVDASYYLNVDLALKTLNEVHRELAQLLKGSEGAASQPSITDALAGARRAVDLYAMIVEPELYTLREEANNQEWRKEALLAIVITLTTFHIFVIGWLLKRWLLRPMEQLNRQVEALARDEPPPEPLLRQPREMANLAAALDRARQSLGTLRQQLLDSERLTTIGQLAAQLAHNLRNPLASIRATAQMASRGEDLDAATRERMRQILASVDRLNQWVAGLMEAARREPTAIVSSDVTPILHRIRELLAPELEAKELTLAIDLPQEGLVCAHDPATLEHALVAMVVNAIEASPLGGRITVLGRRLQRNGSDVCRVAVCDHGSGLPPDAPERIFEFSYSTKQRGMGLGLALARQALQRQGGATGAENNQEGGATVYVELPA